MRLQTWDPDEQAATRARLESELPPVAAAELQVQSWFELSWPEGSAVLKIYADRWPTVDVHQAIVALGRPVPGCYLESWRLPGELDGYPPAELAFWAWRVWELGGLVALRAASQRVAYSSEATRHSARSRVRQG